MKTVRPYLALTIAALAPACTVGPDYRPPANAALKVPDGFPSRPAGSVALDDADLATWWRGFDDPVLSALVERAIAGNPDVATAGARLAQARAAVRVARGGQLPSAGVSGSVARSIGRAGSSFVDPTTGTVLGSSGGDTTVLRGGLDVAWEADIFGGLRRGVEAARADEAASTANLHFAQLSVAADTGTAYLDARQAQARLAIARDNLASQDETVDIAGWRAQAGLVSSLDLEQARQLRAQTRATIPALEAGLTNALNRLAVLTGEAPGAVTAEMAPASMTTRTTTTATTPAPIPLPAAAVPTGVPADTIRRRPDVAAAERSLAAEVARIGVATADLYPALRLSGSFSGSGTSLADATGGAFTNLVAGITASIFEGGQIRGRIAGQRASADAAFATYRGSVLTAIEEVDDGYAALSSAEGREVALGEAEAAARNAAIYARSQYRTGLIDFQTLLEAERGLLSSQDGRASARADRARAYVQLYRALGGGWQAAAEPPPGPYSTKRPR